MRVSINNFGLYQSKTEDFPTGLCLIRGPSGVGKSTIFQSILWCLYGGMRGIDSNCHKGRLGVSIEISGLVITRCKGPAFLTLKTSKIELQDAEAQSYINSVFGEREIHIATCHLAQKSVSLLLSGANKEKILLLKHLAGTLDHKPRELIESKLITTKQELEEEEIKYNKLYYLVEGQLSLGTFTLDDCLDVSQIQELEKTIVTNTELLIKTKKLQEQNIYNKGQLIGAEQNLLQRKRDLITVPSCDRDELYQELLRVEELEKLEFQRQELLLTIRRLEIEQNKTTNFINTITPEFLTPEGVKELQLKTQLYEHNNSLAQKLQIKYNELGSTISNTEHVLSQQPLLLKYHNLENKIRELESVKVQKLETLGLRSCQIQNRIAQCRRVLVGDNNNNNNITPDTIKQSISELDNIIQSLNASKGVQPCPHCQGSVRIVNNTIVVAQSSYIADLNSELKNVMTKSTELKNSLTLAIKKQGEQQEAARNLVNLEIEITNINNEINSINLEVPDTSELIELRNLVDHNVQLLDQVMLRGVNNYLNQLRQIIWYPEPQVKVSDVLNTLNHQKLETLIVEAKRNLDSLNLQFNTTKKPSSTSTTLKTQIRKYDEAVLNNIKVQGIIDAAEKKIQVLKSLIIPETENPITIEFLIKDSKDKVQKAKQANKTFIDYENVLLLEQNVNSLYRRVTNLQTLLEQLEITEYERLQDTVDKLNDLLFQIFTPMFLDSIVVEIKLFKELSNKSSKHQVNLELEFRGQQCSVDQLSGGEYDRVSLGLTLALNVLSEIPLLVLDESMGSLDLATRQTVIPVIRGYTTDKIVLVTDHESIEADYSYCVEL